MKGFHRETGFNYNQSGPAIGAGLWDVKVYHLFRDFNRNDIETNEDTNRH